MPNRTVPHRLITAGYQCIARAIPLFLDGRLSVKRHDIHKNIVALNS